MFLCSLYRSLRPKRGDLFFKAFVIGLLTTFSIAGHGQPSASLAVSKQSFGTVKKGELVLLNYTVTNTGNAPLLLQESEVSCSCTELLYERSPILPGKSATVTIRFNTTSVWGRQDRYAYIYTNGKEKEIRLRYKGNVTKE